MEENLDEIETGKCQYRQVLDGFWAPFAQALEKAQDDMPAQKGVDTGEKCPKCGKALMRQFSTKTGREFTGCSGWRDRRRR